MTKEEKKLYIEQYIKNILNQINSQYGKGIIDSAKINRVLTMFKNSSADLETEIIPNINKLAQQGIAEYIEFKKQIEEIMSKHKGEPLQKVATLDLKTEKYGIYLSQQQIDLLMIIELKSKEELKNYVENICGQFPNMRVDDIIPNFNSLQDEQLEEAKIILFDKYKNSLIGYLDKEQMSKRERAEFKLKKLGINGQELEMCLSQVEQNKINETFLYLGQKYGDDFITKFNHFINIDFENIKDISYDEMKSLSELISNDKSMDTIIIATGKFDNSIYPTLNEKIFDPYLTSKALNYCYVHNKHMRYHTLFGQTHAENLLKQGKGLQDHDQILAEIKDYVKMSMEYIEKNNRQLFDGTKLINTVEIFNELVEKNKKAEINQPYAMIWEKYFGITIEEIVSCFDDIKKTAGVEFMYNETTLAESPQKRAMVEKVLFQIEQRNPNLIDSFGDQMHLSDENVMTKQGRQNLKETAQMLKRIQDGKIIVDGQVKEIRPKKVECTEHDFHFTKQFLDKIDKLKNSGMQIDLWHIKLEQQKVIAKIYLDNGVKFTKCTYWSLFGKNDHNVVRENKKSKKEIIKTMYAGLVLDGKLLPKFLMNKNQE